MKATATAPTPVPLVAQLAAAEAQARDFRRRRAELQEDLADLRDRQGGEMRRVLTLPGGTSPELKTLRTRISEAEILIDEADKLIEDADQLAQDLRTQVAAARGEEEKAHVAAEVARLSAVTAARIAELKTTLEAAAKIGGAIVLALAELEQLDKAAAAHLSAEARHFVPEADLVALGWKVAELMYVAPFEWTVVSVLPPVPGLDWHRTVNVAGYLAARDAATHAASGAQQ